MKTKNLSLVTLCFSLMFCLVASAQDAPPKQRIRVSPERVAKPPETKSPETKSDSTLKVYYLKYIQAKLALEVIGATLQGDDNNLRIAQDPQLNRLIVAGNKESQNAIRELIEIIDDPGDQDFSTTVLRTPASFDLKEVVKLVPDLKVSVSNTQHGIIVRGKKEDVALVESIMNEIQATNKQGSERSSRMLVEVMWLTESSGLSKMALEQELQTKLKAIGFKDLFGLNLMEIRTGTSGKLSAKSTSGCCEFSLTGTAALVRDGVQLKVDLDANFRRTNQEPTSIEMSSEVLTKMGHWMIFGTAIRDSTGADDTGRDLMLMRVTEPVDLK